MQTWTCQTTIQWAICHFYPKWLRRQCSNSLTAIVMCHKILPDYQLAYWENYNMEILLKLTNNIWWVIESQEIMSVTCLNLSAAFDKVDHNILLHVLNKDFGIMNNALKWFENYLRPRNFRVSVNGKASVEREFSFSLGFHKSFCNTALSCRSYGFSALHNSQIQRKSIPK